MKKFARCFLLILYAFVMLYTLFLLVSYGMFPDIGYSQLAASDHIRILLWFLALLVHHILSYFYLRACGGNEAILFQAFYAASEMYLLFRCLYSQRYVIFLETFFLGIIGLRLVSMLALLYHAYTARQEDDNE